MLGRGWDNGVATIVARQDHEGMYHLQPGDSLYHETFDYIADVKPDDGSDVFRATFTEMFAGDSERRPGVGDVARVKFHAKNKEVKFDRDALKSEKQIVANADQASFAALASAPPATADAPAGADSVSAAWDDALAKAKEKMDEYQAAKAAGDPTAAAKALAEGKQWNAEQVRLGDELKRLRAAG
ncbi:MAG TPA: hypothetical protein VH063_09775 [Gaiellaceae bacterium]|jgi:hypothetical protein|nr:hypothetical protein [Gaiellaceae bacterium]